MIDPRDMTDDELAEWLEVRALGLETGPHQRLMEAAHRLRERRPLPRYDWGDKVAVDMGGELRTGVVTWCRWEEGNRAWAYRVTLDAGRPWASTLASTLAIEGDIRPREEAPHDPR